MEGPGQGAREAAVFRGDGASFWRWVVGLAAQCREHTHVTRPHSKMAKTVNAMSRVFHNNNDDNNNNDNNNNDDGLLRLRGLRIASLSQELFHERFWILKNKPTKKTHGTYFPKMYDLVNDRNGSSTKHSHGETSGLGGGAGLLWVSALRSFPRPRSAGRPFQRAGPHLPGRHPPSEGVPSSEICRHNSLDLAFNSLWKGKKAVSPQRCFVTL